MRVQIVRWRRIVGRLKLHVRSGIDGPQHDRRLGALRAMFALLPMLGGWSLPLIPTAIVALGGCPGYWAIGLMDTITQGRLARTCDDDGCHLVG